MVLKEVVICQNCKTKLSLQQRSITCPHCSANAVEFQYQLEQGEPRILREEEGIWRYSHFLPRFEKKVSLGEGNTPLREAKNLFQRELDLLLKIEGKNPTGSFLDRISSLMVSDALSQGMDSLISASDGNLGASLSAYCAAAGIKSICVVPKNAPTEKRAQMIAYGAQVIDYGETIDSSLTLAKKMTEQGRYQATPELNILTIEGAKTIALEIVEQLAHETKSNAKNKNFSQPEYLVVPMGSGSLLYAIWKGFKQAKESGLLNKKQLPKIIGVQLKGFDPITKAFTTEKGKPIVFTNKAKSGKKEQGLADAILVHSPFFGGKAIQSIRESGGIALSVTEQEMIAASKRLGKKEGVFAELSSATVIAAIAQLQEDNYFSTDAGVLAIITASGLKTSGAFHKKTTRKKRVESFRSMGTKVEILRIIDEGEANFGYGIWKALGKSISLQAIYQHLQELTAAGHIGELKTTGRKKKYQLTERGKKLIKKMSELEELLP
ncbi:MAG: pyridoxal-phosphate dependent enzyme [Candidatus Heimdallarchaeota archaeon]|nr:pyridoxal-phosphate dependent enzyme [Candidatus Heimdallarchaeota archaeon]